jgi:hypothetical protein
MGRVGWLISGVVALLVLCVSVTEGAVRVSPARQDAEYFSFASNRGGDYLIAWTYRDRDWHKRIWVTGGNTEEPIRPQRESLGFEVGFDPWVAVGEDGTQAVMWATRHQVRNDVFYGMAVATRPPGGDWVVQRLARRGADGAYGELAFGPGGRAIALWPANQDEHARLMAAWRPAGATRFGKPYVVYREPTLGGVYDVSARFDDAGRPTLAWSRGSVGCGAILLRAGRPCRETPDAALTTTGDASGTFAAARLLKKNCGDQNLSVAGSGAAAIIMTCNTRRGFIIRLSRRPPGGTFERPRIITGAGRDEYAPRIAVAENGNFLAAWIHRKSFNRHTGAETARLHVIRARIDGPIPDPTPVTRYRAHASDPIALTTLRPWQLGLAWSGGHGRMWVAAVRPSGQLAWRESITRRGAYEPAIGFGPLRQVVFWVGYRHGNRILGRRFIHF